MTAGRVHRHSALTQRTLGQFSRGLETAGRVADNGDTCRDAAARQHGRRVRPHAVAQGRRGRRRGGRRRRGNRDRQDDVRSHGAGGWHGARDFFDEGALVPVFTNLFVIGEPGESVEHFRPAAGAATRAAAATSPEPVHPQRRFRLGGSRATTRRAIAFSPRASRFAGDAQFLSCFDRRLWSWRPGARTAICAGLEAGASRNHGRSRSQSAAAGPWAGHRTSRDDCPPDARVAGVDGPVHVERIGRRDRARLAARARQDAHADGLPTSPSTTWSRSARSSALLECPDLNAEYVDGRIVQHADVHLGVRRRHAARAARAGRAERSGLSIVELSAQHESAARHRRSTEPLQPTTCRARRSPSAISAASASSRSRR